jgi:hypothetical protein
VVAVSDEELMRLSDIIRSKDKVPHPEVAARHLLASGTYQRDESLKSRYRFR